MLLPALGRAREQARRAVCATNLHAIHQGLQTYANEYSGRFPSWGQRVPGFTSMGYGWDWDPADPSATPPSSAVYSNPRNLWILVRKQLANGKIFICPSDNDAGDPWEPADVRKVFDFQNRTQLSYSFQYQGPGGLDQDGKPVRIWNTSLRDDPRLVLMADKSPMFEARNPTQTDPTVGCDFEIVDTFVDALSGVTFGIADQKFEYVLDKQDDLDFLNSQNHRAEGQNVLRLDGSAFWAGNPWVGASYDLIWTVQDADNIDADDQSNDLVARAQGEYNVSVGNEDTLLDEWVLKPRFNKRRFPDSFLVP